MRYRGMIVASVAMMAGLAIVSTCAWLRLPADAVLPTHWGPSGLPDRTAPADVALAMPVLLTLLVTMTMIVLPGIEPLQDRLEESAPLYRAAWGGVLAMMALVEAMVAGPALGIVLPPTMIPIGVGMLFIVIGNMLPKSRPGFFIGIRTPWALIDRENWIATHRLGGRTMMAAGALILIVALLPLSDDTRGMAMIAAIAIGVVPPLVYSYLIWRRHQPGRA
jgi:uncharacterized membrane protein